MQENLQKPNPLPQIPKTPGWLNLHRGFVAQRLFRWWGPHWWQTQVPSWQWVVVPGWVPACPAQEGNKAQKDFTEGYNCLVGMDPTVPEVRSTFNNDVDIDSTPTQSSESYLVRCPGKLPCTPQPKAQLNTQEFLGSLQHILAWINNTVLDNTTDWLHTADVMYTILLVFRNENCQPLHRYTNPSIYIHRRHSTFQSTLLLSGALSTEMVTETIILNNFKQCLMKPNQPFLKGYFWGIRFCSNIQS